MNESLRSQVKRLADVIMQEIPGEPSQDQGAIDTAIRLLRVLEPYQRRVADLEEALEVWKGQPDVWERVENWLFNLKRELGECSEQCYNSHCPDHQPLTVPEMRRELAAWKGKCGNPDCNAPYYCPDCRGTGEVPLIEGLVRLSVGLDDCTGLEGWEWQVALFTAAFTVACLEWLRGRGYYMHLGKDLVRVELMAVPPHGKRYVEEQILHAAVVRAAWQVAKEVTSK
jgi:hypothetical protein